MELNITEQRFAEVIGTPSTEISELYARCSPLFPTAQANLEKAVNYRIAAFPASDQPIVKATEQYVCLCAYLIAIPQLDLIWTPTGFGIVQNNTLAPASRERVDALRTSLTDSIITTKFQLLELLFAIDTYAAAQSDAPFIVLPKQYKEVSGENITDTDFDKLTGKLKQAERRLRHIISQAELDNLRNKAHLRLAGQEPTAAQCRAINAINVALTAIINELCTVDSYLADVLDIVNNEDYAEDFSLYRHSSECEANNTKPYENTADKSTFFFC